MSSIKDFEIENGVLVKYHGNDEEVTIPDGVTAIGKGAFKGFKRLRKVTIPNSVTTIVMTTSLRKLNSGI